MLGLDCDRAFFGSYGTVDGRSGHAAAGFLLFLMDLVDDGDALVYLLQDKKRV